MSLHTITPEQLSIESLWAKVRSYYPAIQSRREYDTDYNGVLIGAQLTDDMGNMGSFFIGIIDDWDGDQFIAAQGTGIRSALINIIPAIEHWIDTHMERPLDEEEDDD